MITIIALTYIAIRINRRIITSLRIVITIVSFVMIGIIIARIHIASACIPTIHNVIVVGASIAITTTSIVIDNLINA